MTKKKKPTEQTDDQAIRKMFPKDVVDEAKERIGERKPKKKPK